MKSALVALIVVSITLVAGCKSEPRKVDNLGAIPAKIRMGMTEFDAVQAGGPPSLVLTPKPGVRVLRYEGTDGAVVEVTLTENRVTDIQRKD